MYVFFTPRESVKGHCYRTGDDDKASGQTKLQKKRHEDTDVIKTSGVCHTAED